MKDLRDIASGDAKLPIPATAGAAAMPAGSRQSSRGSGTAGNSEGGQSRHRGPAAGLRASTAGDAGDGGAAAAVGAAAGARTAIEGGDGDGAAGGLRASTRRPARLRGNSEGGRSSHSKRRCNNLST